jgi:hypothetical protein
LGNLVIGQFEEKTRSAKSKMGMIGTSVEGKIAWQVRGEGWAADFFRAGCVEAFG